MSELPEKYQHLSIVGIRKAERATPTITVFQRKPDHQPHVNTSAIESIADDGVDDPAEIARRLFHK